jgi:hypothetical protein
MESTDKILRFAGDVSVDYVKITTPSGLFYDVTPQMAGIEIFEDLFTPFMTGSITIRESVDLLNAFPFTGQEYLEFRISTPQNKSGHLEGKFYIYKMSNRELIGDKSVAYELHFITQEAIVDLNKTISRSFDGKVSEIAQRILEDTDIGLQATKKINIEETKNEIKYISNFWSPVRNLKYLCDHALNKNDAPNYVFFENRAGFNFVSLDSLYANTDFIEHFVKDNFVRTEIGDSDIRNNDEDYRRIRLLSIPVVYDYMNSLQTGMIASKQYSFDIISKNVDIKEYDMFTEFPEHNGLNLNPLYSKKTIFKTNSFIINRQRHWDNFTDKGDSSNSKFLQKRISLLKAADSSKIQITVPGRTQYTVGQKVLIELNKIETVDRENKEDTLDKYLSGAYIIGAINHSIDRNIHECTMELFKDSLLIELDGKD